MTVAARKLRPLILICDDELPLRELIKAALGDTYRYVEAGDVREAEDALSSEEPVARAPSWSSRRGRAPTTSRLR